MIRRIRALHVLCLVVAIAAQPAVAGVEPQPFLIDPVSGVSPEPFLKGPLSRFDAMFDVVVDDVVVHHVMRFEAEPQFLFSEVAIDSGSVLLGFTLTGNY